MISTESSEFELKIEENLKWRTFVTKVIDLKSLKLNI
jgi:hypothetical protein